MQRTNISASPYNDDYSADKNFHRVLFKPRPVQSRELNQVQSIFMDQISRMGNHIFAEGSMVIPGGIRIIKDQDYVMINFTGVSTLEDILNRENLSIKSATSGLHAKIARINPQTGTERTTLFIDYMNSGSGQEKVFAGEENCVISEEVNGVDVELANISVIGIGRGTWAKVTQGVWFVRGMFVQAESQDIVVNRYSSYATAKIGFKIIEEIIDETKDESLLSNALGTPNYKAPGADRLKVTLQLISTTIDDADVDFIELARIEGGIVQSMIESTEYSVIQKSIAQRTFETHGDYALENYDIEIKEHLKSGNNGGIYAPEEGGTDTKLVAAIKPGIAYVKGYRVENKAIAKVPFDKARDTVFMNNSVAATDYGPYVLIKNIKSLPKLDITKKVNLLSGANEQIGYCRVRSIRKDVDAKYRVYIFDVNMNIDKSFGQVVSMKYSDADSLFSADLDLPVIYASNKNSLVFALPVSAVKTLLVNGASDTSYTVLRSFYATTNGAGVASIGVGSNEAFNAIDDINYLVSLTGANNVGTHFVPSNVMTLTGSPIGSSLSINLGASQANKSITIVAPVTKLTSTQRTKTLSTINNEIINFANVSEMNLSKCDIKNIISIVDNETGENITESFTMDNGQRSAWYQPGIIQTVGNVKITKKVKVSYRYFEHSGGDYFSVDSYGALSRNEIGTFAGVTLADCVDFRPRKDANGEFSNLAVNGELIRPNDTFRSDLTYYLSRIDVVFVSSSGEFGISRGISSANPEVPNIPPESMKLFELFIPAFTYDANNVKLAKIDNRRYTMRDIGRLEDRIKNVEYYTTLSALETKANLTQIFDPVTGNSRYKNGFAVDGFSDFRLSDFESPNYNASIDDAAGELKPKFVENGSDYYSVSSTAVKKGATMFLKAYTETVAMTQPYATKTININPYAVFTWVGVITMSPSSDFWKDVVNLAPVIVNNVSDRTNGAKAGTVWSTWSGFYGTTTSNNAGRQNINENTTGNLTEVTTVGTRWDEVYATTTTISRSTSSSSTTRVLGTEVIPFMRSIDINVTCQKFKPYTQLYVFWDDVDVNAECKPEGGVYGGPIMTNENGNCKFVFKVPNRADKKFRTGTSSIRVIDTKDNDSTLGVYSTLGEATFNSGGTLETRQQRIVNNTVIRANTSSNLVSRNETVIDVRVDKVWNDVQQVFIETPAPIPTPPPAEPVKSGDPIPVAVDEPPEPLDWDARLIDRGNDYLDPIAQTFRLSVPGGCFVTKIDIFFATKAKAIPVVLELRTVLTGLPTGTVFARKILNPDEVKVSTDGKVPTSFVFDDPVYFEDNVEYCIVMLADTQEYTVYISELGENVIGEKMALAKQPNMGIFLTSANSSTWTPNQLQDLKFTIHRAVFDTNVSSEIVFNGNDPIALPVEFNGISTVSGSNLITVKMQSNGLKPGDTVVLSGATGGNGIVDSTINDVAKIVVSSTLDTFTIQASANATATGTIGGLNIKAKANYPFALFMANIDNINFARTGINWEFRYVEQGSRNMTPWYEFSPQRTFAIPREGVMRSGSDFQIRATMKTLNASLSPIIFADAFTNLMISPRINNDFANPVFSYETRQIQFDNPSTSAMFYVGAKLPAGSNMKFFYKTMTSSDQDLSKKGWTELAPTNPITNDNRFLEYSYDLKNVGTFIGYKIRIVLVGTDPIAYPSLTDFRSIALA